MEWEWSASVTSPLNGPASNRCSASSLNKRDSGTGLCLRPSPLPGNRIPGPETTRPKTPPDRHWSLQRLQRDPRSPPIRGYSPAAGKSPLTCDCVVADVVQIAPVSPCKRPKCREILKKCRERALYHGWESLPAQ